jgi:hypothetical protein
MQLKPGLFIAGALLLGTSLVPCAQAQNTADTPPAAPAPATAPAPAAAPDPAADVIEVPAGTKILLSLQTAVDTRTAKAGDGLYLVSTFPVMVNGRLAIPPGVFVQGVVNKVTRPGRVKGRASVGLYFTSLIFQNGTQVFIPGNVDRVPGSGGPVASGTEGTIEQAGTKGKDAQTIANTTVGGASVGALVGASQGNLGAGAGYGAIAGGAAGLAYTMFTRGSDIVLPQGQSIEMVLQRPLTVKISDVMAPSNPNRITPATMPVVAPQPPQTQALPKPQ